MKFKTILALVFAILIVVFALHPQNSEVTDFNFFVWKVSMFRVLLILGSFSIGVLVGILVFMKKRLINLKMNVAHDLHN